MTKSELVKVMTYIFTDHDHAISENKRDVWFDQFGAVDYQTAMQAARVLITRKMFGLPRVADFADALRDCKRASGLELDEGQAFNLAVKAVQRFGYMDKSGALDWLKGISPRLSNAVDVFGYDYLCKASVTDAHSTRAQFGKVFLAANERAQVAEVIKPSVSNLVSNVVKQLGEKTNA